ncbi:MAG: CHAP domain-containing protein [Candidatus Saccharimonadales bacterium]
MLARKPHIRKTKSTPKLRAFASYAGVFVIIIAVIAIGYRSPQPTETASISQAASTATVGSPSVDEVVATDVAANLAEQTNMSIANNVANLSLSLAAKTELAQTSETAISKPQIIQPTAASRDISSYVSQEGDTVQSVAAAHNLQPDTVRWANNLSADTITAGKELTIPPVDGVVYTVKAGDTADSIATNYSADKERIVAFNDLELNGFTAGKQIVLPGATLPEEQRPGYQAPVSSVNGTTTPVSSAVGSGYRVNSNIRNASAGNRYAWGNCTWYAYERRLQMGRPVGSFWGNANTWAIYARADGYPVNRTPARGAVLVDTAGYYGHVAVVEDVLANGDVILSEMNNYAYGGFGVVNKRTISAGQAAAYTYIH